MSPTTIPGNLILQSPAANDPLLDLNTQPSLDLQFATSKTLDDRVSGLPLVDHQRDASGSNSPGTYVGSDGLIKTSKVNLLRYSEEFNDTYWFKRNSAAIVPNAVVSPDGNTTADELQHPGGSTYARIETTGATPSVTLNASYSFTIYAKYKPSSDANYLAIQFQRASGVSYINLSTKTVDSGDGDVELLGSGWIRFRRTLVATSTGTNQVYIYPTNTTNTSPINIAANAGLYIWGAQLEEGNTASPYIKTTNLPSAAPRFDHDPTTNASLGLLVEESRTNEIPYSEDFTTWGLFDTGDTLTSSALTSPDGTLTGTLFAPDNTSGLHIVRQSYTFQGGTTYTLSVFVKEGGRRYMQLAVGGSSLGFPSYDYRRGVFDLQTGSVNSTPLNGSADIKPFANGWYRCSMTITPPSGGAANFDLYHADTTTPTINTVADGNGTDGIYIWGAQLEEGAFATSYIPTSGSTVTRAADVVSITGSNFSRWYNQSEGTVYIDFDKATTERQQPFALSDGAQINRMAVYYTNTIVVTYMSSPAGGFDQSVYTAPSPLLSSEYTIGYSSGNTRPVVDGSLGTVITEPNLPTNTTLYLGRREQGDTTHMLSGHISRLTYYPYRLPDATLQEITS